jgi:peptidylprolyl isomerase
MIRRIAVMVLMASAIAGCTLRDDGGMDENGVIPAPADVAAPPTDAQTTASGLASKMLRVGMGSVHPSPRSSVTVHYTGWTTDGRMFETSTGGAPATFSVGGVIPGWTEGLQLMVVGEKRRFWIPGALAYDNIPGMPGSPQGMLVFDIELLDVR